MTEVEKEGVKEQESATPVEETEITPQASVEPKDPVEGSKEYNWRQMEQSMQEVKGRNVTLENKNFELTKMLHEKAVPSKAEEPDELAGLDSEDLLTYGQKLKMDERRDKKSEQKNREIIAEELAKREREALPAKVKGQYKDYDQVVTDENIEKLVQERPAWENTIKNDVNPFETAYCLIKQSKFYREKTENRQTEERIADNTQKPVSSNTIGSKKGPLSQANAFATQSKDDLWAEMNRYAKGAGSAPEMR